MIKVLEIVTVNLCFTSEAASQIINFYKIISKVKIFKRVKLVFIQIIHEWLQQFSHVGFTCLLYGLTSYTEKH